jgi:hypothetical protein
MRQHCAVSGALASINEIRLRSGHCSRLEHSFVIALFLICVSGLQLIGGSRCKSLDIEIKDGGNFDLYGSPLNY